MWGNQEGAEIKPLYSALAVMNSSIDTQHISVTTKIKPSGFD